MIYSKVNIMTSIIVVCIIVILFLIGVLALSTAGSRHGSLLDFYSRSRAHDFTQKEIAYLKSVLDELKIDKLSSLFWSDKVIDSVIRTIGAKQRLEGVDQEPESIKFLAKIYDLRKKVLLEGPKTKGALRSSARIAEGTRLRVIVEGLGVLNSKVYVNTEHALEISVPVGQRVPAGFVWRGKKVSVYFWRASDAGYSFDSYVIGESSTGRGASLLIGHTDSMFRTQKRQSIRVKGRLPAYLYILKRIEGAYEKPEKSPGMKCFVEDLSEDGAAVFIGGKAKPDMLIKLQFYAGEILIVMSGTAKSVEYDQIKNQSLIHMQAQKPSPRMRNMILSYVYNVYNDEENL
jgi:hypothetical protein